MNGIPTAEIYCASKGDYLMEYIPASSTEALQGSDNKPAMFAKLARLAALLDKAGYATLNFISDMRYDESGTQRVR